MCADYHNFICRILNCLHALKFGEHGLGAGLDLINSSMEFVVCSVIIALATIRSGDSGLLLTAAVRPNHVSVPQFCW